MRKPPQELPTPLSLGHSAFLTFFPPPDTNSIRYQVFSPPPLPYFSVSSHFCADTPAIYIAMTNFDQVIAYNYSLPMCFPFLHFPLFNPHNRSQHNLFRTHLQLSHFPVEKPLGSFHLSQLK